MIERPTESSQSEHRAARLPPRWFIVTFWYAHRAVVKLTHGRVGLWQPKVGGWGALRLITVGRRSGRSRAVLVGYIDDGEDLVVLAMNGWGAGEPAWWLNLQAHPSATVRTRDGVRTVCAHRVEGGERDRLWARWAQVDKKLDAYAARRPQDTAVVVLRSCRR